MHGQIYSPEATNSSQNGKRRTAKGDCLGGFFYWSSSILVPGLWRNTLLRPSLQTQLQMSPLCLRFLQRKTCSTICLSAQPRSYWVPYQSAFLVTDFVVLCVLLLSGTPRLFIGVPCPPSKHYRGFIGKKWRTLNLSGTSGMPSRECLYMRSFRLISSHGWTPSPSRYVKALIFLSMNLVPLDCQLSCDDSVWQHRKPQVPRPRLWRTSLAELPTTKAWVYSLFHSTGNTWDEFLYLRNFIMEAYNHSSLRPKHLFHWSCNFTRR